MRQCAASSAQVGLVNTDKAPKGEQRPSIQYNIPVGSTGFEPARGITLTRPSTWRVCQFRHEPGSAVLMSLCHLTNPSSGGFARLSHVSRGFLETSRVAAWGQPGVIPLDRVWLCTIHGCATRE